MIKLVVGSLLVKVNVNVLSLDMKPSFPSFAVIVIVGAVLSPPTTMALLAPRDPLAPGLARVRDARFPAASVILLALVGIMARPEVPLAI